MSWWESRRRHTAGWFLGLITLVGRGQGALSLSGPLQKHAGRCQNRQLWGWAEMTISLLLFSLFCLFPFYLSLGPHDWAPVPCDLKPFSCVFKFCNWYICLCCSFLSVQPLLQPSADIVGMGVVEHFSLEIQTQPRLTETPALGFLLGF